MKRAFILLFDSFGIGASTDADKFGDAGANTLGHIAKFCAQGKADKAGLRQGLLQLPNLTRLGLHLAAIASSGERVAGLTQTDAVQGAYGYAVEQSFGKDTPSGHWEIAGVPALFDWGYFPKAFPSFPKELTDALIAQADLPGILGNKHASGTDIINELGDEHSATGKPIVYTSADSVLQIAAHEEVFDLQRLYKVCKIARKLADAYHIGRVIARPFLGADGNYYRTANRRDITTPPPAPTLLDKLVAESGEVIAIGKVSDIFAGRGISQKVKADGNMAVFDAALTASREAGDKSLIFANFVDFDMLYGHRRDVAGYAAALEALDRRLPEFEAIMQPGDIAVITADHGCDPTLPGSDHSREHVPVLVFGPNVQPHFLGRRDTFADMGQTIAEHLGIAPLAHGISLNLF